MDDESANQPLLGGRGVMLIDQFSQATGLDGPTAAALVTERKVEGLCSLDGRVVGVFDDALPTKQELGSWGLSVPNDYDPERHRSYVGTEDGADALGDEEEPSGSTSTWTMSWGEDEA